jgi:hypothetical protein
VDRPASRLLQPGDRPHQVAAKASVAVRVVVRSAGEKQGCVVRAMLAGAAASTPGTNEGKTLTYSLMRGRLTENGGKVFAGFYPAPTDNEFGCVSASFTLA